MVRQNSCPEQVAALPAGGGENAYPIPSRPQRVRDIPERLRPREEMERIGVENVSDDVLLAVLLRGGVQGQNVVLLARHLLEMYGSLTGIASASVSELTSVRGLGPVKAQVLKSALELARRLNEEAAPARPRVRTPSDVFGVLKAKAKPLEHEVFWVLMLDTKNRLKGRPIEASEGLLDASLAHPREIFREAVRGSAAAVILAHNHPSGDCSPSAEDVRLTKQLVEAGKIVDIDVLDHVIIGAMDTEGAPPFFSLREAGLVSF